MAAAGPRAELALTGTGLPSSSSKRRRGKGVEPADEALPELLIATRSMTSPPCDVGSLLAAASASLEEEEDEELGPWPPRRRTVSEPAPARKPRFLDGFDGVNSALTFIGQQAETGRAPAAPIVNFFLLLVSLVSGCLVPALVDLSRTADVYDAEGQSQRRPPYNALSVLCAEALLNVLLGVCVIAVRRPPGGFSLLWDRRLHQAMFPLTLVYCLSDLAALFAIGSSGGVMYSAVTNSRLLFAAAASHVLLGRPQTPRQWLLLAEISVATAIFAVPWPSRGSAAPGGSTSGVTAGICWAVCKAFLSGLAAVLTEQRYKRLNMWHASTLLKGQSLLVTVTAYTFQQTMMQDLPLCLGDQRTGCISYRGWDRWTVAVLVAEMGAGWLSVMVLIRMSAVSKFICKAATSPSLYLLYCATGLAGTHFEVRRFVSVMMIAVGIFLYSGPQLSSIRKTATLWVAEYSSAFPKGIGLATVPEQGGG